MRSKRLATGTLLAAVIFTPTIAATADWTIHLRGAGPMRIGMSLAEVRQALGDQPANLRGNEPEVPLDQCAYLESSLLPSGIGVMFAAGRVVRIDVLRPGIRTAAGAGVGDSEETVKRIYAGHITVEPHFYDAGGHYLTYRPKARSERSYGMVFETDGKTVTAFRTGTLAAIALVEGCS